MDYSWAAPLAAGRAEDWAKFYYLHNCCDYSLKMVSDLFPHIEVRCLPIDVAAAEYFDAHFLPEIPAHLRRFVDYDGYAMSSRDEGFMVSFIFDAREYTAIGFA